MFLFMLINFSIIIVKYNENMTNKKLVSRVVNDGRFLTKDENINKRFILGIARDKATTYMSHKLADNTLFEEDSLFSYLDCFKLQKVDSLSCGIPQLNSCDSLMKSVEKLPSLFYSRLGNSIVSVSTLDNRTLFDPLNLRQYSNYKKRPNFELFKKTYYYVKDGYLYLTDTDIKAVDLIIITPDKSEVDSLNDCKDCDDCKSLWDYEFVCSQKIEEVIITETISEVMGYFRQIQPDENPNLSENQKDSTTI